MLLVYLGIVVLFLIQPNTKQQITNKKWFCIISGVFLFLIAAIRDLDYGDVYSYKIAYNRLINRTYSSLFNEWISGDLKDFGFYAFSKFFADLGFSANFWVLLIAAIFAFLCSIYLYKFSEQPFIGLVSMLSLFYIFTFTGLRQAMSLGITFLAYTFISKKKPIAFVISVLIASLFHSSALILLPAYLFAKMKIGYKQPFLVMTSVIIAVFFPNFIRNVITTLAWNESLEQYADRDISLSWTGFIIQLAIWIFCIYFRRRINEDKKYMYSYIDSLINLLTIGLCLQCFAVNVAEAFRLSYYYSFCAIALMPNVIEKQTEFKNSAILQLFVPILLVLNMLRAEMYFDLLYF